MALNKQRLDFIQQHKKDVIEATLNTGIFPSVKMAQMIVESSNSLGVAGQGITALKARNYFGIKANTGWKGEKMAFNTPKDGQPVNYFRVYPTVKDSIKDHTDFLIKNPRYTKSGVFDAKTPFEQLSAIEAGKYAEGANYARKMAQIIKDYNLEALDREAETLKKKD